MDVGRVWLLGAALVAAGLTGPAGCTVRAAGEVVVDKPPPPARYKRPAERRPGYLWVRGQWVYRSGSWEWRQGRWIKARRGYRYLPGRWVQRRGRYHWIQGRWEPLRNRNARQRRGHRRR